MLRRPFNVLYHKVEADARFKVFGGQESRGRNCNFKSVATLINTVHFDVGGHVRLVNLQLDLVLHGSSFVERNNFTLSIPKSHRKDELTERICIDNAESTATLSNVDGILQFDYLFSSVFILHESVVIASERDRFSLHSALPTEIETLAARLVGLLKLKV